jgi:hypothetical protein
VPDAENVLNFVLCGLIYRRLIAKMRDGANSMGFLIPPWRKIIENVEKYGNPFGEQKDKRSDWIFGKKQF